MLIKAGVDISRLERNTRRGLRKVADIFLRYDQEVIITSAFEGNHGAGSLHYANQAFDVRFPSDDKENIEASIFEELSNDFDVLMESDHIHIEYDPK
jgi:hypothetical protein